MDRETKVLIVEDDFYACNWMELLLRRDWRTRVVGEVNSLAELSDYLEDAYPPDVHKKKNLSLREKQPDLILIDTDMPIPDTDLPEKKDWLRKVLADLEAYKSKAVILFTGVAPSLQIFNLLGKFNAVGYILKSEIRYSFAWAVALAAEGHMVVTPGISDLHSTANRLQPGTLILDGRNFVTGLSKTDTERARMAFLYSMERNEFADELGCDEDYAYGIVSELFRKIGLNDVLQGLVKPEDYFGDFPSVLVHVNQAIEMIRGAEEKARKQHKTAKKTRGNAEAEEKMIKVKEKESLAFHRLTFPDIEKFA